ncbi:MAG: hypothetical protein IRY94_11905, partial [Rhodospirillaceae bacterium]|nr:hypothetical protein [Rhodospirillaceae bacterium]
MAMMVRRNAIRAFEPTAPVDIYRVAGRRPSMVWVDADGRIAQPGPDSQRLKELVYWRTRTNAGDQLQERVGGMYLVTPDGGCHPIALCPPSPLEPATAFQHAQALRHADAARLEELLAVGLIVPVSGRRPEGPPSRPGDRLVPSDQPRRRAHTPP